MSQQYELITDHPNELQVWCVWSAPPFEEGWRAWAEWLFGVGVRVLTGRYGHIMFRKGGKLWSAEAEGVVELDVNAYNAPRMFVDAFKVYASPEVDGIAQAHAMRYVGTPYDFPVNLKCALRILGLPNWMVPDDGDKTLNCCGLIVHPYAHGGLNLPAFAGVPFWAFAPSHILRVVKAGAAAYRGRVVFKERTA